MTEDIQAVLPRMKKHTLSLYRLDYYFCFDLKQLEAEVNSDDTEIPVSVYHNLLNKPTTVVGNYKFFGTGSVIYVDYLARVVRVKRKIKRLSNLNSDNINTMFMSKMLATLTHEAAHLSLGISGRISYNPTKEQEPFCYLLGDVVKNGIAALLEYDSATKKLLGPSLAIKRFK